MNYSENYNFALPEDKDGYDISPLSENFEALDGILTETETAMDEINAKIGTPIENGQTLFSLLGNKNTTGLTAIKSIQRITCVLENTSSKSVKINPVVSENCVCIFERLQDGSSNGTAKTLYTLENSSVTFSCMDVSYHVTVGLWIIEFC